MIPYLNCFFFCQLHQVSGSCLVTTFLTVDYIETAIVTFRGTKSQPKISRSNGS
jgi:hypothetical protein